MAWSLVVANLHIVISAECFVADRARELGWADEDLGRRGDPVLSLGRTARVVRVA